MRNVVQCAMASAITDHPQNHLNTVFVTISIAYER